MLEIISVTFYLARLGTKSTKYLVLADARALQRVLHSPLDTFFQHIFVNLAALQDYILN